MGRMGRMVRIIGQVTTPEAMKTQQTMEICVRVVNVGSEPEHDCERDHHNRNYLKIS